MRPKNYNYNEFEDDFDNYLDKYCMENDCFDIDDNIDYMDVCSATDCTGMLVNGPGYVDDIENIKDM